MVTKGKEKSMGKKSKGLSLIKKNLTLLQKLLLKKREEIFKEVRDWKTAGKKRRNPKSKLRKWLRRSK